MGGCSPYIKPNKHQSSLVPAVSLNACSNHISPLRTEIRFPNVPQHHVNTALQQWRQRYPNNAEDFHPAHFSSYLKDQHGTDPSRWHPEKRKGLFYSFEMWKYPNYRIFLEGLPDYHDTIIELCKRSNESRNFQHMLQDNYVEEPWFGLFGGKSIDEHIREQVSYAKNFVAARKKREERDQRVAAEKVAKNEAQKRAKKAQEIFLAQEEKIEHVIEQIEGSSHLARSQQRMEAFQTALDDQFKIEYKSYEISKHTTELLQKQNIDPNQFEQCTGNAIQQQFHQEFVEILNNSADLTDLDIGIDKDVWFFTIGDFSNIGSVCNNAGQYSLTQKFADLCFDLYSIGECAGMLYEVAKESVYDYAWTEACAIAKEIYNDPKGCAIATKEWVEDFSSHVLQKAVVRPLKQLSELAEAHKKDPLIVPKLAGHWLQTLMIFAAKQNELEHAARYNPHAPETETLCDEFQQQYLDPLQQKVSAAVAAFHAMPTQEKAEEVAAFLVQMGIIKGVSALMKSAGTAVEGLRIGGPPPVTDELLAFSGGGSISVSLPTAGSTAADIAAGIADATEAGLWSTLGASKTAYFMEGNPASEKTKQTLTGSAPNQKAIHSRSTPILPENGEIINGRFYTKHALEKMAPDTARVRAELEKRASKINFKDHKEYIDYVTPRRIPLMAIEDVLDTVKPILGKKPNTLEYFGNGITVITNETKDVVITVFKCRNK